MLKTYTVISHDYTTVHNNLTFAEAKELVRHMPQAIVLTIKDNHVTAIRGVELDGQGVEFTHLEKTIINKDQSGKYL